MKSSWKQIIQWLCMLACGAIFAACGEATLIGQTCIVDLDCHGAQCVRGTCVAHDTDANAPDTDTADANGSDSADANGDANKTDTTSKTPNDACTGEACEGEVECDPGFHICDGVCVHDASTLTCGEACETCLGAQNGSPTCTDGVCGVECDASFFWDDATAACVQCHSNADCTEPGASACNDQGQCVGCTQFQDCAHLDGTTVCTEGTCSECSELDASACGPNSCNPATNTCTDTPRGGLMACQECVSDSECAADYACVPMEFKDSPRQKSFCLPIADPDCEGPFPTRVKRRSAGGVHTNYCTLNEALTTCEAYTQYGTRCGDASECGADGFIDSLCEPIEFDSTACTFPCSSSEECPNSMMFGCASGGPDSNYCGAY